MIFDVQPLVQLRVHGHDGATEVDRAHHFERALYLMRDALLNASLNEYDSHAILLAYGLNVD